MTRSPAITPITRPMPTAADRVEAERLLPMMFPDVSATWLANNRPRLIEYAADAVMLKRMDDEHRAEIARRGQRKAKAA